MSAYSTNSGVYKYKRCCIKNTLTDIFPFWPPCQIFTVTLYMQCVEKKKKKKKKIKENNMA